jgi:hypothetical protein
MPPSLDSLHLLAKFRCEADRPALRDRRVHELASGGKDGGNSFIMDGEPSFELCEAAGQFPVRSEHLSELDEGAKRGSRCF